MAAWSRTSWVAVSAARLTVTSPDTVVSGQVFQPRPEPHQLRLARLSADDRHLAEGGEEEGVGRKAWPAPCGGSEDGRSATTSLGSAPKADANEAP